MPAVDLLTSPYGSPAPLLFDKYRIIMWGAQPGAGIDMIAEY